MTSNYITAQIAGTVGRTGTTKADKPYAVVEIARNGAEYPDRITVWGLAATTGDAVEVRGKLSWKKTERDGKTYVDVSLNDHETIAQETPPVAAGDPWNAPDAPGLYNDETPF